MSEIALTPEEWRQAMERSVPCPLCNCKLIELDDEGEQVMCPRCNVEREDLTARYYGRWPWQK